jgi:SLOG cluster4 family
MAVVGPGDASPEEIQSAELIGRGIAQTGDVLVCGGLGGVMAAAARGAAGAGDTTVGLLPGTSREAANQWIEIALALKTNTPVIGLGTWEIEGIEVVDSAEHALKAIHERTQTIHEHLHTIHNHT